MNFDKQLVEQFNLTFDLDETKLTRFLAKTKMDLDTPKEQALYELNCGELKGNNFIANNTGILFFAKEPTKFVQQSLITCVRYHGNSMASVIDRKDLQTDLLSLVDQAEEFVKRNTRLAYLFDGFKRIDIEEYPYDAIKEAIINAVCHRNYFDENNVFVNIFDDKVEIISPGNIPDNLTLNEVIGESHPRNHTIVNLFKKAGYIEKLGSGIKRMQELMLFHGLQLPKFEANNVRFKATFLGPQDKILQLRKSSKELDLRELGLNERQIKILNHLQNKGPQIRKQIEQFLQATKKTTIRDLSELIKKGFVKREGESKKALYKLTK